MSFLNIIRQLAVIEVPPGTQKRFVCPACRGGTSGEASLVITHFLEGGAVYKCHRASCGVKGSALRGKGVILKHPKFPKRFDGYLRALSKDELQFLYDRFGLTDKDVSQIRFSDTLDRFMFPVRSYYPRELRGWIARSFNEGVTPKALTYKEKVDEPFLGYEGPIESGTAILVEDYLSSLKIAAAGYVGVCLNGTYCSPDGAAELERFNRLIVALDKDAFSKGIDMVRRYEGIWRNAKVWYLDKDLRYVAKEDIRDAVKSGKTNFSVVSEGPGGLRGDLFSNPAR